MSVLNHLNLNLKFYKTRYNHSLIKFTYFSLMLPINYFILNNFQRLFLGVYDTLGAYCKCSFGFGQYWTIVYFAYSTVASSLSKVKPCGTCMCHDIASYGLFRVGLKHGCSIYLKHVNFIS